nr:hypothetical protein [uncultured Flavonifractor sp.]
MGSGRLFLCRLHASAEQIGQKIAVTLVITREKGGAVPGAEGSY